MPKENGSYFSHDMAVGDAMMQAQAFFTSDTIRYNIRDVNGRKLENKDLEKELVRTSSANCDVGTISSLYYLRKNFSSQFDFFSVLTGYGPFSSKLGDFGFHMRFLVHGGDAWYSASPANHRQDDPNSSLLTYDSSKSIRELMRRIRWIDKGVWTPPDFIEEIYRKGDIPFEELAVRSKKGPTLFGVMTFDGHMAEPRLYKVFKQAMP